MKIYIVEGNTGEYSDRVNWLVKAFKTTEKAEAYRDMLHSKLLELKLYERKIDRNVKIMQEYDEQFQCDYTGSEYTILTVEMDEL